MASVFSKDSRIDTTQSQAFFDDPVAIARYDRIKYQWIEKLTEKQLSFFWRPEEVDVLRDAKDFKALNAQEQHIFTSNLKRQILLDSVQGRSPNIAFLPIVSLPELETWICTWAFSETIHSRSYTHIIRNVYADPSVVFDEMLSIQEIVDCAHDVSVCYDELIQFNQTTSVTNELKKHWGSYSHKKYLWKALMAVNILEGVRFYVSFACSWAFAETKRMEGNAKIIKLIARDENLHLAGTQQLLKTLVEEDKDFEKISLETRDECTKMFVDAIEQEKTWAKFLFKDGSMLGLTEPLLCSYAEWIGARRMKAVGLDSPYKTGSNPLPWTQKWISGSEVQVAPQETEISSYQIGAVKMDVSDDTLNNLSL